MKIELAYRELRQGSSPQVRLLTLEVADAADVASALKAASFSLPTDAALSLFGKRCELSTPLYPGARVEVCGPLQCDPKLSRRLRYTQKQAQLKVKPKREVQSV